MRVRLRHTRTGKVRWTSARDLARMWERAIRRVALPMAYTAGFSPRPKISFGLALSTGHESTAEYVDLELDDAKLDDGFDLQVLPSLLTVVLPAGIDVTAAVPVDQAAPSLQHDVTVCRWEIEAVGVDEVELETLVRDALAKPSLVVTRVRKGNEVTDDLRPSIRHLALLDPAHAHIERTAPRSALLEAELATQPRGVRPGELLLALSPRLEEGRVRRTHQFIERDGARWEPIPPAATAAPHAERRAS